MLSLALLIILLGATLRMWHLLTLPPACVNAECIMGLRLLDPALPLLEHNPLDPFGWVAHALFSITDNSLLSLRLAGAAIGIITLPVFFAAATQVSDAGGALLATLLLALNPWHIAAGQRRKLACPGAPAELCALGHPAGAPRRHSSRLVGVGRTGDRGHGSGRAHVAACDLAPGPLGDRAGLAPHG